MATIINMGLTDESMTSTSASSPNTSIQENKNITLIPETDNNTSSNGANRSVPMVPYTHAIQPQLRIPSFNASDPVLWFKATEEQFRLCNINDERDRYSYTVAALPADISAQVRDIILHRPEIQPYTAIKNSLMQRVSASYDDRLERLLREEVLGDRKPTQLLIKMKSLASDCGVVMDAELLKKLFLKRLPENVREILSITADNNHIDVLAAMADKIVSVNRTTQNRYTVHNVEQSTLSHPNQQPPNTVYRNTHRVFIPD